MADNPPPRTRHYATIGIDDVFLEPVAHPLPKSYLQDLLDNNGDADKQGADQPFVSFEIIGTIKETPEDFCVREIAKKGRTIPGISSHKEKQAFQVADILSITITGDDNQNGGRQQQKNSQENGLSDDENQKITVQTTGMTIGSIPQEKVTDQQTDEKDDAAKQQTELKQIQATKDDTTELTKANALSSCELIEEVFLELLPGDDKGKVTSLMKALHSLEKTSIKRMATIADPAAEIEEPNKISEVFIPRIPPDFSHLETPGRLSGVDRRAFHEAFRLTFPLLKCETLPENDSQLRVTADNFFDDLIPYLCNPQEDLPIFYRFHKRGCVPPPHQLGKGENVQYHKKGGKRKRDRDRDLPDNPTTTGEPILRLKPDLSKDDRRPIHRIIAQKNRAFQTRTLSNHPLDPTKKDVTTSAIQVHWALAALKRASKKLKTGKIGRNNPPTPCKDFLDPTPNTICVLRKRGKEHLTAITALCSAIKCRTGDVGLAGIKDMRAVTYQFCTLRNVGVGRLKRAIPLLQGGGIEIGTMRKVGFMLQNGDLQGNRFVITLKGVKRVHVEWDESDKLIETFRSCEKAHIREMFERVQRSGFINYYGEQRVGAPGKAAEVGVRTVDVGRAMLQGDFASAIDLLMTGRTILHSRDVQANPAELKVRAVWKESKVGSETLGDPAATLKAFPRNESMPRERAVMKGLQRYGRAEPLAAIQCLPHNVRRFWLNAYQSGIWNAMASARLLRLGSNGPVIGDLFMENGAAGINDVQVVDSENISSVSLDRVVLPLPGYGVIYPANEIGDAYKLVLQKDSVSFEKKGPDEGTAKGAYRHLIARAENMDLAFPDDGNDALCTSSFTVSFDLPAGSYATMLLRELMLKTVVRD